MIDTSFSRPRAGMLLAGCLLAASGCAQADGPLISSGYYQYSLPTDEAGGKAEGQAAKRGVPVSGAIAFVDGALTDGSEASTGAGIGWRGRDKAPTGISVVFDLLQDRALDRIEILARAKNKFWNIQSIEVQDRAEGSENYRANGVVFWKPDQPVVIPMQGRKARYVRVRLRRAHPFVNVPLEEVRFFAADDAAPATPPQAPDLTPEFKREIRLVDRYGQYLYEEWPGKIHSDAQLAADAAAEDQRLPKQFPQLAGFDQYGGKKGKPLKATGFFRTEKVDGRWWLVTPEGHPYFVIGMDGAAYRDGGYGTPVLNPDDSPRGAFEELPDKTQFAPAYSTVEGRTVVNFVAANLMRKYGPDYDARWANITDRRLRDWGFNTHSKWSREERIKFPYITVVRPAAKARKILWAPDPFDPNWEANVREGVQAKLTQEKDNPWIVGHTFENERGWDHYVTDAMLKQGADSPAKVAFVRFLVEKAGGQVAPVAQKLGVQGGTVEEIAAKPVNSSAAVAEEIKEFTVLASRRYHEVVRRVMKQYGPNHLYLGGSLVPGWRNSPEWVRGSAEFVDVLSFDAYKKDPSWIEENLAYDKPILLLEFSFSVVGRGLRAHSGASAANSHRERGLYYRYLVEQLAAKPQFVGFGFFLYYDQAVPFRSLPEGENFNMGIVNQQDQPYEEMIDEVRKTNRRVYEVHTGTVPPVGTEILPAEAKPKA